MIPPRTLPVPVGLESTDLNFFPSSASSSKCNANDFKKDVRAPTGAAVQKSYDAWQADHPASLE